MRRFLRAFWKVDLALTLAVAIALYIVSRPAYNACAGSIRCPNTTAAQANLQTALTGAATFYASNHDSYVGIDGGPQLPAGVSSIAGITGLRYVAGYRASTDPNMVSIYSPSRSVLVVTAYSKGLQTCFGILRVPRSRAHPYFPAYPSTANVGTFYFRGTSSASADCTAASVVPTALNTTGFPAA